MKENNYHNRQNRQQQPQIKASKVRLIDETGEMIGIVSLKEALDMAEAKNLDLIQISPEGEVPVCKIADYGRIRYNDQKKKTEMRKKQKVIVVKEIQFRPRIEEHDYQVKFNHAKEFLEKGYKLRVLLQFRGREISFVQMGEKVIERFIADIAPYGKPEGAAKLEGKRILVSISPLKN